jgi:hypothetical protein
VKLISQIDAVAAGYGISIGSITVKGQSAPAGNSIGEAQPPKPYESAVIGFTFKSSYENFNTFMNMLGKSMRILDIKSMKLDANKSKDDKALGIYLYGVEFETYWLNQTTTG